MPKFVLMTRLVPAAVRDAGVRETMGKQWLKKVKAACPKVKWIAHYALLGPYDFMDIYDAPDVETAHRISVLSRAEGAWSAESWQALPYEEFLDILQQVEP